MHELSPEQTTRELERICGSIGPDGATIEPSHNYASEVKLLANEVERVRLYPRQDLAEMPAHVKRDAERFFDGSTATVPTSSVLETRYGQPARRARITRFGLDGTEVETIAACALLRRFPLVLTARKPIEKKKEK
jgi:hypothetical protein